MLPFFYHRRASLSIRTLGITCNNTTRLTATFSRRTLSKLGEYDHEVTARTVGRAGVGSGQYVTRVVCPP